MMSAKMTTSAAMVEVDPDKLALLDIKRLNPQVQDFFAPWLNGITEGELHFTSPDFHTPAGLCPAGVSDPVMVRHHFLCYSAIEVLCFCNQHTNWLERPGSSAFTPLGLFPSAGQIKQLQLCFPNAKIFTVLDNDLIGRTLDCKLALWSKNRDAGFYLRRDNMMCNYLDKIFWIPEKEFSLHRFQQLSGLRSGIRTFKPRVGFISFLELHRHELNI